MEAATVRERYGNARGLSVAATVSNPIGHHPYLHDSTRGSQRACRVERSSTARTTLDLAPGSFLPHPESRVGTQRVSETDCGGGN